ncbi:MAG: hypothetical protein ACOC1K_02290 [Nanoarchaeota archaeon]
MKEFLEKKKLLLEGEFEDVIEIDNHFYLVNKKDKICVLPYTISTNGLLDKIGIIEDWNNIEDEKVLTLLNDYISTDDYSNILAANRILFEVLGNNVEEADRWMYLGSVYNNMTSDSPIKLYCVDITDISVKTDEEVHDEKERKRFRLLDSSSVLQTDDILFLAAYLRLFNYFYVNSLKD